MDEIEKAIEERIAMYEERSKTVKRQYAQMAALHTAKGLEEALLIIRGKNPDKAWMGYDDDDDT